MTATTERKPGRLRRGALESQTPAAAQRTAGPGPVVPAPPRYRRRPWLAVLAATTVVLGGLLGVSAWTAATTQSEVVAVRADVERGAVIEAADLMRVRVGVDPALRTVPAASMGSLVGKRAAQDLPAGSLVNPAAVAESAVPGAGMALVGLSFESGQLPGEPLKSGDRVRVVTTPPKGAEAKAVGQVIEATVAAVRTSGETASGGSRLVIDLLVPAATAPEVAVQANSGGVALVLDSRER